jgi:hypothetical protein
MGAVAVTGAARTGLSAGLGDDPVALTTVLLRSYRVKVTFGSPYPGRKLMNVPTMR